MKIITRKNAIHQGLKFYFTGKPCKHGHTDKRRVPHGACVVCEKEMQTTDAQREYHRILKQTPKYKKMAQDYRKQLYGTIKYQKQAKSSHLRRTYNLTLEQYEVMLREQHNNCLICRTTFTEDNKPHVDHCHTTNKVRGLLCCSCNFLLGYSKDNINILEGAIKYLQE